MSSGGTQKYLDEVDLPPLVAAAVDAAQRIGFDLCVHPATGRLLQVLAAGVGAGGVIGETGTGTGAGLAWLASGARLDVSLISVELDAERAAAANQVFASSPNVTVMHGDAGQLFERGPFDLLVLDGGWGSGKNDGPVVEVAEVLTEGGVITIDDFTPMQTWPPTFEGSTDAAREHWLTHADLLATEVRVDPTMSVIIGRRTSR